VLSIFFLPFGAMAEYDDDAQVKKKEKLLNILTSMPVEDRQGLESLFRYLMADGDFGYTLFGDKPVAFSDFYIDLELGFFFDESTLNSFAVIHKGWLLWQKYKSYFPSHSFILIDYVNPDYTVIGFALYHKQKIEVLYDKYQPLMSIVFGHADHIPTFLNPPMLEPLKAKCNKNLYHQAQGLLLGYDEKNTERFRDKFAFTDALMSGPFDLDGLNAKSTKNILSNLREQTAIPSDPNCKEFRVGDMICQLNYLSDRLKPMRLSLREETLSPIKIPKYMAFEGEHEILTRQKAYDTIRDHLIEIYFAENFLEIILLRLQS
jgi:hypothetical protein